MICGACLIGVYGVLANIALGQSIGDNRPSDGLARSPEATISLSGNAELRRHFSELESALRRLNAEEMGRLYEEHRAALAALSKENADLSGTLFEENRAEHETLRGERVASEVRAMRTREIQEAFAAATAERQAWYTEKQRELVDRYASDRSGRRARLDADVERLNQQMDAAFARLRAGAGSVAVPAEISGVQRGTEGRALQAADETRAENDIPSEDRRLTHTLPNVLTMRGLGIGTILTAVPSPISITLAEPLTMHGLGAESVTTPAPEPIEITLPETLTMTGSGGEEIP